MGLRFFASVLLVTLATSLQAQIKINEYSASNINTVTDGFGNQTDWVELFNTGATAVSINGYHLSDTYTSLTKWKIPATPVVSIPAGGRILLYCSGQDTILPSGQIHAGLKLTQCDNESIIFSDATGVMIDSANLRRTQGDDSWGRVPDGAADWKLFTTPSPNAVNTGGYTRYVEKPTMNVAPGFYTTTQNVTLACADPNTTIHYTITGIAPTTASPAFTTPVAVAATTVIRAMAVSTDPTLAASFIESNTYFINVSHKYPILSIAGTLPSGSAPAGGGGSLFGSSTTVRHSVEFFDTNKNFKWETNGFAYKHGHDSWAFSQKGFRISAEDEMGYTADLPEKFFENSPRNKFNVVILKAGASDNFPDANANKGAHMRDAFLHTYSIKHNFELDERAYAPCIVFINGQYWGIYEIRERVDLDYVDYYYNQSEKKTDMVRHWGGGTNIIDAGSDSAWTNLRNFIVNNDMTIAANYASVEDRLNINSIIDFFILNNYVVNTDHLNWNTMWWRGRKGTGVKWRYALWDTDNIFDLGENYSGWTTTGPEGDPCEPINSNNFANSNIVFHTQMIKKLFTNATFKATYADRYAYWVNKALNCDSLLAHLAYFENLLDSEMPAHATRWGGTYAQWKGNVDSIRQFILARCALVGGATDNCGGIKQITLNVDPAGSGDVFLGSFNPPGYPFKGAAVLDSNYAITAVPKPGRIFKEWKLFKAGNIVTPDLVTANAKLLYKEIDSIVAVFIIQPKDSFNVTVKNEKPWAGTVMVDGLTLVGATPITFRWEENTTHTLEAASADTAKFRFNKYTKETITSNPISPNVTTDTVTYRMQLVGDIVVANWDTITKFQRYLYLPNAITPNGDGRNEMFGNLSRFNPDMISAKMQIVDRYGTIVYNGDAFTKGWDGKRGPRLQDDSQMDTYFYYLEVKLRDKTVQKYAGDLQVIW
jgi:gliding motility-associated-like protein